MSTENDKAFPGILAVDPYDCGCTECIIGEYIPEGRYVRDATAGDLAAVISGEVRLNTYSEDVLDFILSNAFETWSARDFVTAVKKELAEMLASTDMSHLL